MPFYYTKMLYASIGMMPLQSATEHVHGALTRLDTSASS